MEKCGVEMLIGEVAKRSGLSKDGIRHYEALGLIHSRPVEAGSRTYRDYDDTTLERLSIIALAKRLHFKLSELVDPLNRLLSDQTTRQDRQALLADKVAEIDQKIEDLIAAREILLDIIEDPEKAPVDTRMKALGLWVE